MTNPERTEKATPKRREEARKRGQVPRSQEVGSLFVLTAGFTALSLLGPTMLSQMERDLRGTLQAIARPDLAGAGMARAFDQVVEALLVLCLPIFGLVAAAGAASSILQVRPKIVVEALKPNFKRINPLSGAKKFTSPQTLVDLVKNLVKLAALTGVVVMTVMPHADSLVTLGRLPPTVAMSIVAGLVMSVAWRALLVLLVLAVLDFSWTRHSHEKSLKMSKQEVKQESRNSDMPPEVKSRIKAKARQMSRARMLNQVSKADVVITNPTHVAVALAYRRDRAAPEVLAKGADLLAARIRELAAEHDVPMVEHPPLARQLYADVEVGYTIPAEAFAAVAEVLAFVWRTSRRRRELAWI